MPHGTVANLAREDVNRTIIVEVFVRLAEKRTDKGLLYFLPSEWVRVEALDQDGKRLDFEARGLYARVIQHEIDHLDGILFIDRLDPVSRDRIKRRIKKEGLPAEVMPATPPPFDPLPNVHGKVPTLTRESQGP